MQDKIDWDWEHEFQMLEEEVPLEMSTYIFKYVMGFGSMIIEKREILRTDNPLRFKVRYKYAG